MVSIHFILEDLELRAARTEGTTPDGKNWAVMVRNNQTTVRVNTFWSDVTMSAVAALAIGGGEEGFPDILTLGLYELAEHGMADLPTELRIIP